jgi:hypothetical protein
MRFSLIRLSTGQSTERIPPATSVDARPKHHYGDDDQHHHEGGRGG